MNALVPGVPDALVIAWVALVGAMVGSFLNVVIYRVPVRRSIAFPGSRCGSCESPIRWFDNVPVLSWLVLGARCRRCGAGISVRYAIVEALTSILFVAVLLRFGVAWHTPVYAAFTASMIAVSFIDADHRIIPDSISKSGIALGIAIAFLLPAVPGDVLPVAPRLAFAGAVLGYVSLLVVSFVGKLVFRREAMGLGDVKLLGMIGAFLGPLSLLLISVVAPFFGVLYGILWPLVRGRRVRGGTLPFGPFLAIGAVAYLLGGSDLVLLYLRSMNGGSLAELRLVPSGE